MEAIEIRNLTKTYSQNKDDVIAADHLNLTIHDGELFSLLGVNGAGKTTTIKMLSCLTKPTDGDALLFDKSIVTNEKDVKSCLGISPQETAVAANLTVRENLNLMCGIHGFDRIKSNRKIKEMNDIFQLGAVENKRAGKLSGGWQRRLSIAMALIGEPKILFLDEPTLGLDVIARGELWKTIRKLKGQMTIILTTHYMEEAEALSDRIAIMKNGHLIALGTADSLKAGVGAETFEQAFIAWIKGATL